MPGSKDREKQRNAQRQDKAQTTPQRPAESTGSMGSTSGTGRTPQEGAQTDKDLSR